MKIELIVQNSLNGETWHISNLVTDLSMEHEITDNVGKLSFSYINDNSFSLTNGSFVSFKVDTFGLFFGRVFKISEKEDNIIKVTVYDNLRYLKNKDTFVIQNETASDVFKRICESQQIDYKITDKSFYKLPPNIQDNKSYADIIKNCNDLALVNEGNWFIVRDVFGVLEFISLNSLKTNLYLTEENFLTGYSFEKSIDEDTYNEIMLVQENKDTATRERYVVKESQKITEWGKLRLFEKVDENANSAQIQARAEMLLKLKNRETKKTKISSIGNVNIRAGNGVFLGLNQDKYYIITKSKHKFENNNHLMDLDLLEGF